MSDLRPHNDCPPDYKATPARMTGWAVLFAVLMLLFVILSFVVLVLPRGRSLSESEAARRTALVGDRKEKQLSQLNSYGWVNEKNHQAHIPINVAMEKFVKEGQTEVK